MKLGQLVTTRGVDDLMAENRRFAKFISDSLHKYIAHDWGQTCEEDKAMNDQAIIEDERIIATYKREGLPTIWIITEWDRSATTVLFPDEY